MNLSKSVNAVLEKSAKTNNKKDIGETSDGYHTFNELYEHRHALFIALCKHYPCWKSRVNGDGSTWKGWFLLGIGKEPGEQITYHLPDKFWDECSFAKTLKKGPEFDGHTSDDVVKRLHKL